MEFKQDYLMSQVTSFGVGGPADYFCQPTNIEEIQIALHFGNQHNLPITVIGYGTNLLVCDKGIRGLVIQIAQSYAHASVSDTLLTATAGCITSGVSKLAAYHSLTGMEFAVGIPGSFGGALYMNAGAYGGEIGPLVESVTWVTADQVGTWNREEYTYSYRHSRAQDERVILAQAQLKLELSDQATIYNKMQELQERRLEKQPLEWPSAGSTFKRPPGHYVGTMIEECKLKGYQIGGAQISTKHAGFIINAGGATAQDIFDLIAYIQKTIKERYNVDLETEVRIIGER